MTSKSAIVTGGSYEEGLSVGEGVARAGYAVSLWDDDQPALEAAQQELKGLGFTVDIRHVDVADVDDVQKTYEAVRADFGVPAALFNMATLKNSYLLGEPEQRSNEPAPFWRADLHKLRRILEVNAIGTLLCSAVVAPDMVAAGGGSIINFSTSASTQRDDSHIPYGPSKSFVESFSIAAALQLVPHGVRVNVISAGGMVNRRGKADPRHVASDWADELVAYLAGDESAGVTAQLYRGAGTTPLRDLRSLGKDDQ